MRHSHVFQMAPLVIFRYASQPTTLGPYTAPAGSLLVVSPKGVHDSVFPSPDAWNVANFFNAPARPAMNFLGFGHGQHRCKGERIASFEAKSIIATIVRRYRVVRLSPDANTALRPDYVKPSAGLAHPQGAFLIRLERLPSRVGGAAPSPALS